ncbi:MAG: hypothetical protein WBG92_02605 [Thiohalocapsa sp.]
MQQPVEDPKELELFVEEFWPVRPIDLGLDAGVEQRKELREVALQGLFFGALRSRRGSGWAWVRSLAEGRQGLP